MLMSASRHAAFIIDTLDDYFRYRRLHAALMPDSAHTP